MEEDSLLLPPIIFNCWKHHAGFIKDQIRTVNSKTDLNLLKKRLVKIGESQMDLYFGKLTPSDISKQISSYLKKIKCLELDNYKKWLKENSKEYRFVKLSDKSTWTLRLSENQERYIHIHPERYSPYTTRAKATTLKTAILILCFKQAGEIEIINSETVNQIRKTYLGESPLKSLSKASGVTRLINLFS